MEPLRHSTQSMPASGASRTKTDHNASVIDQVFRHVTITDRTHPFFGRTFPVVRDTSSRGVAYLVVQLPHGRTRSVPIAATDDTTETAPHSPSGLLPISARTLLPVARHLQAMVRAKEEVTRDASSDPQPSISDPPDTAAEPIPRDRSGSNRARPRSAHPVRPTPSGTDPTHSSPTPRPNQGGAS